jgi:hypothetical protein
MERTWSTERATWLLLFIALATMIAHVFTGAGFGFHGDELQFMDDAHHLAWGYVTYPPMTPFFARLSLVLFGTSIAGFRFFASRVARPGAGGRGDGSLRAGRGRVDGVQLLRQYLLDSGGLVRR